MQGVIYTGPTLSQELIKDYLPNVIILPPAKCGDILKLANQTPALSYIALIDGYFDTQSSVWHKEILYALEKKIPVYGAASMGALRAAECKLFGMIGVGQIYQDYISGKRQEDADVALLHLDESKNYLPLSDPLVNITATLDYLVLNNIINKQTADNIESIAINTYYKNRSLRKIISQLENNNQKKIILNYLNQHGLIDLKQQDAISLLKILKNTQNNFNFDNKHSLNLSIHFCKLSYDISTQYGQSHLEIQLASALAGYAQCQLPEIDYYDKKIYLCEENKTLAYYLAILSYQEYNKVNILIIYILKKIHEHMSQYSIIPSKAHIDNLKQQLGLAIKSRQAEPQDINDNILDKLANILFSSELIVESYNPYIINQQNRINSQSWLDKAANVISTIKFSI